uniref:Uncharacterized protein n=1 Tax=Ochrobactrum sp. LM19 TaxID=1449781 RepID=A0A0D5A041_9HYPH|nr:hypothetical protein [Ochrobactrum sp. LM19]AJW29907.1 hypothetical protein pLM19O1_p37 [Ochrobactrum sp. LM19]
MNAIHGASQAASLLPASFAGIVLTESFNPDAERIFWSNAPILKL